MKLALFITLLVISVATLVGAIFGDTNQVYYAVATIIGHIGLVAMGYFYAKKQEGNLIQAMRNDLGL